MRKHGVLPGLLLAGLLTVTGGCSLWSPASWFRRNERPAPEAAEALALPEAPSGRYHVVQKGETISAIGRQYAVEPAAIIRANHLGKGDLIMVGQRLLIPVESAPVDGVSVREWRRKR